MTFEPTTLGALWHYCTDMARDLYEVHGRSADAVADKQRELQAINAQLAQTRASIQQAEDVIKNSSSLAEVKASYQNLLHLTHERCNLESDAWELSCTLSIYKHSMA